MKAVAHSYWRSIKRGTRSYESIPPEVKEDVLVLAKIDIDNGKISNYECNILIGNPNRSKDIKENIESSEEIDSTEDIEEDSTIAE